MQEKLAQLITTAWFAAWDEGDLNAFDGLTAPGYARIDKATGRRVDLAGLKAQIAAVREAFPDLHTTIDEVVEGDGAMAVFWNSTGTHVREYRGVPATGLSVQTRGSNVLHFEHGKIREEVVTWDGGELLAAAGIRPLRGIATPLTEPDPTLMKEFNRRFVTGVTVVTARDGERPRGLAANAYCSVSLEPPLVLICVQKTSSTHPALFASGHLGINILGVDQRETVAVFAGKAADKFADLAWHEGPHGSPLVDGSSASIEAEITERIQTRTHTVFVCRVQHAELGDTAPMIYQAGRFYHGGTLAEP